MKDLEVNVKGIGVEVDILMCLLHLIQEIDLKEKVITIIAQVAAI